MSRRRPPAVLAYRSLVRMHWSVARWAILSLAVVAVVAVVLLAVLGTPENSVVGFARQAVIWFPFSMAIALVVGYVNVHVALGQTRRALARGAVLSVVTMSAVYAVAVVGLIQAERAVYAAAGWRHLILDDLGLVSDSSQVALLLAEYLVAAGSGQLCGLLCGLVYYRYGGWWGTVALPLTVGPIILVQAGMSVDVPFLTGGLAVGTSGGGVVRTALAVVVLAAVAVAFGRILRTTPIRTAPIV